MPTGACLQCRYDLAGAPETPEGRSWRCPECGRLNHLSDLNRGPVEQWWWKGLGLAARVFATALCMAINLFGIGITYATTQRLAPTIAVGAGLCVVEGLVWVAWTRLDEGTRRWALGWLTVSALLMVSTATAVMIAFVLALRSMRT